MIARLLISPSLTERKKVITQILSSHISSGSLNDPDLLYFQADSKLGIEQARQIKSHLSTKPHSLKGKIVILENASSLTTEAQNALLKILEEPPKKTLIILSVNSESDLIDTVTSRCEITRLQGSENLQQVTGEIEKLLNSKIGQRFEYIEKLKDKEQFLKNLTLYFHQNLRSHPKGVNVTFLNELLHAEMWAKQNVNIRAILEYLMLVMPARHRYAQALAGEPSK